jgi:dihydropyrimidinase
VAGALPVCSPPLRPATDRDALWRALSAGALDLVTTDHCPFTADEKATGLGDFSHIPGGVPSIETGWRLSTPDWWATRRPRPDHPVAG